MTKKADPPANDFAARLDLAMTEAGVSQNDLERTTGAPHGYVSRLRSRGAQRIDPTTLFAIADALKVDARWLFTGRGTREGVAAPTPAAEEAEAARLRTHVAVLEEAMHAIEVTCRGALRRARR